MVQHRFYVLFALAIAYPQLTATPVGIFIFFLTEQEFDPAILNWYLDVQTTEEIAGGFSWQDPVEKLMERSISQVK